MARGDYSQRVTATSRDEVGELARAFNSMAAELAEVDRMRRDLVANVSHELRTPISALQAVLENLVDGVEPADPETLTTMLRAGRAARHGSSTQLLDLSRLESGRGAARAPAVRASSRCSSRRPRARPRLHDRIDVARRASTSTRPGSCVDGDPERVHQVVANLLDNAVRHSPPGGVVSGARDAATTAAVRSRSATRARASRRGRRSRVFERFYRADAGARRRRDGGTGLGLAIARWIVDLHGGDIRAERNSPHGCRMVVELPRTSR